MTTDASQKISLSLTFNNCNGGETTAWYSLTPEAERKARIWLGEQKNPTALDLKLWLAAEAGAVHDRADGPAWVETREDGFRSESYYRDGLLQKRITTRTDGTSIEEYWHDGRFQKEIVLPPLTSIPGVKLAGPASGPQ